MGEARGVEAANCVTSGEMAPARPKWETPELTVTPAADARLTANQPGDDDGTS
ncbi:hypothetical protein EV667_2071 [Ancylobacter aquaticus]|uniref:Uncharacterized protein n=2 Tax=Ancylobacter aquaticus TaxID=100 RepID=A0A4R1I376_ANCAQ|nr:hypothetical protein EV667_2071 [Ancylobacter aquaticus]